MHENHLAGESSPYLRQHAHQPVDWYPWSETALEKAKREDKPIMLSIGYSTCHWCHVMAHESFDDENTAAILNREFVSIKVDREERPDLDKIYQTAHQLLTQRGGGWPLTVFLRPNDHVPFFAGTYFPREPRYGLPDFKSLLSNIAQLFRNDRQRVDDYTGEVKEHLKGLHTRTTSTEVNFNALPLDSARRQLGKDFDAQYGGFGGAPKFPHPTHLERLLRHWALLNERGKSDDDALNMVVRTLETMADGGINDQLGGGFYRYSVDEKWLIPHFEKMLYDNGALLWVYSAAWLAGKRPAFEQAAATTANWMLDEMRAPEGGFYSALDADSEGEEGKFYVWSQNEVRDVLGDETYPLFAARYGLDGPANFEGQWHLFVSSDIPAIARRFGPSPDHVGSFLETAKKQLLEARSRRIRPSLDYKILTSWNGLAIKGLAFSGRTFDRVEWIDAAAQAHRFIRERLWSDGRLFASFAEGQARHPAYLDDYAFMLDATLELLQSRYDDELLNFAEQLAEGLLARFEDPQGGFFFTAHDHETLLLRPKSYGDEAMASGSGVAALALGRLGHMLAETRYLDAAERALRAAWRDLTELPHAHDSFLHVLEERLHPPQLIFLRGPTAEVTTWRRDLTGTFSPRRRVFAISQGGGRLPGGAETAPSDKVVAYRCDGFACSAPIHDLAALKSELSGRK